MTRDVSVEHTTITLRQDVYARLNEAKPFDSMSFNEFVELLLEEHNRGSMKQRNGGSE